MANIQINQLPVATLPLVGTELVAADQGAQTVKVALSDIVSLARPYKVYTALLSATGTTLNIVELQNTIGPVSYASYGTGGEFALTTAGLFTTDKTVVFAGNSNSDNNTIFKAFPGSTTGVFIKNWVSGVLSSATISNVSIEIRVYP